MTDTFQNDGDAAYYLRRLVDHAPSLLAYWDADLRCRFANRAYQGWFGVAPEALVGMSIRDLLGPDLYALNEPHILAALQGREQTFERIVPGPNGGRKHSLANYMPDIVDGEVIGFLAQVTEITQLKQAEYALRDSEQKFRTLAESSPLGVFYADPTGRLTYTNARWQEIYGMTADQALGDGWTRALHPDDRERVVAAWRAVSATSGEFEMEFRILRSAGDTRHLRTRARAMRDEPGMVTGFVGALEDVTEQRSAERRLRESEMFLDRTGRIAGVGGWEVDLRTRKVTWSAHTRRIHELPDDHEPAFLGTVAFYAAEDRATLDAAIQQALRDGTAWDLELPFITAKGRPLWVRIFGEVERENGAPIRLVGAFQDITEHRRHKEELLREQERRLESERHAQELDRLLDERGQMLDVLAHEVRQPLNNASAALQSAAATLSEQHEEAASGRLMRAQVVLGQVLASIDNTLAVASLLARPDPIDLADTDIDTLLAVTAADMSSVERGRIVIQRSTGTRTASMDMSLMRLALRNLLSNALRYSAPDTPVIIRLGDSDEPLALLIDVIDRGPGIAGKAVPTLFERGATRGLAQPGSAHGMGLGLYIVRRVMELHGGRALLEANGPGGATFRLEIAQPVDD